jgi:hypothetical protein
VNIYVDYDNGAASDAFTRATQSEAAPIKTLGRGVELAQPGDQVLVKYTATAPNQEYPYFPTWPGTVATAASPITIQGVPGAGGEVCRIFGGGVMDGGAYWIFNDLICSASVEGGTDAFSTSESSVYLFLRNCGNMTFNRIDWRHGGTWTNRHASTSVLFEYNDCITKSVLPSGFDGNADGRGHFYQALGASMDPYNGANYRLGSITFRRCIFRYIQGEDAIQLAASYDGQVGTLLLEDCVFHDVTQAGDSLTYPHCDCVQVLAGDRFVATRNHVYNCSSGFNAFDYPVNYVELTNNIFHDNYNTCQFMAVSTFVALNNTWTNSLNFGLRLNDSKTSNMSYTLRNNVWDSLVLDSGTAQPNGTSRIEDHNYYGSPTFASDNGSAYGLPSDSPLIGAGVAGVGVPTVDFFQRTRFSPPTLGAIEPGATGGGSGTGDGGTADAGISAARATATGGSVLLVGSTSSDPSDPGGFGGSSTGGGASGGRNVFINPATGEAYTWAVNHREEGTHARTREVSDTPTAAAGWRSGARIIHQQGKASPVKIKLTGVAPPEQHARFLYFWKLCAAQTIHYRDFTGTLREVLITGYEPTRTVVMRGVRGAPEQTSYTLELEVINTL